MSINETKLLDLAQENVDEAQENMKYIEDISYEDIANLQANIAQAQAMIAVADKLEKLFQILENLPQSIETAAKYNSNKW